MSKIQIMRKACLNCEMYKPLQRKNRKYRGFCGSKMNPRVRQPLSVCSNHKWSNKFVGGI